jgi:hypothetical protein
MDLEVRKLAIRDTEEYDRLKAEHVDLVSFQSVMKHTLNDNKPPVVFHLRLLQDFGTIKAIAQEMLKELNRLLPRA